MGFQIIIEKHGMYKLMFDQRIQAQKSNTGVSIISFLGECFRGGSDSYENVVHLHSMR